MRFPINFDKFLVWFFYRVPKRILVVLERIALIVNNETALTLNLSLLFTPLFGDYTIIGRIMGFIFRIFRIIFGLLFMVIIFFLFVFLPVLWLLSPLLLLKELGAYAFLYVLFMYFAFELLNNGMPDKKVTDVKLEGEYYQALAVNKDLLELYSRNKPEFITRLFIQKNVSDLLDMLELNRRDFLDQVFEEFVNAKLSSEELLKNAFLVAKENSSRFIEPEHLFLCLLDKSTKKEKLLAKNGTTFELVKECAFWLIDERDDLARLFFWQPDYKPRPIGGVNRGWTGRVTPILNSVSQDFTKLAAKGMIEEVVGKDKAIEKTIDALSKGSSNNVLIIGEPGSGKTTMVRGIANKIVFGTNALQLKFKRLVSLEIGALIAGCKTPGEVSERLESIIEEIRGSKNIILFIDEVHNLVASSGGDNAQLSTVFSTLEPHLSSGEFQFIGATSIPEYRRYIEPNGAFSRLFQVITLDEASKEDTLKVLKLLARKFTKQYRVGISFMALTKIIDLSSKLIRDRVLPDKAVDLLERACVLAQKQGKAVTSDLIREVVSDVTHVPVSQVGSDESKKLLNIEAELKKRVIGQDNAINLIADALRRARVGVRDEKRPIASFLFVGSTGVGKTETAKAVSDVYFGGENLMIRVDMSEYQKDDSVDKLIGTSDGKTVGLLTDKVRRSPFSLILLDEIEKASPKVLLLFLQVLDDARLTDNTGRSIDFTNSIVIATSNVGTSRIQEVMEREGSYEDMDKEANVELRNKFAPEFLNRFSGIVTFKPLYPAEVERITLLLLSKLVATMEAKGVKVNFSTALVSLLSKKGFDPKWGARPLRRLIERTLESFLARKLLEGSLGPGDSIELGPEVFDENKQVAS